LRASTKVEKDCACFALAAIHLFLNMPFHFDEIPSTQLYLKELLQKNPDLDHLEHVQSDSQSAGIGRMGRNWVSEKGNLCLSVYLRDFSLPLTWIPHWVGVAALKSLVTLGVPAGTLQLKWPNDLIVKGRRKAGGILCEKLGNGVIAGIGINLVSAPDLSDRTTSEIRSLAPKLDFFQFHLKLADAILHELKTEPSLANLKKEYQSYSLLQANDAIQWLDLQTQATGRGTFIRYGEFGELIVQEGARARALFSEEIKLDLELNEGSN
jgi:biotin-[acetyl-CoA-carboxylase] ligase BirA-like protein